MEKKFSTACTVQEGVPDLQTKSSGNFNPAIFRINNAPRQRNALSTQDYVAGVQSGSRMVLARAITLIESSNPKHFQKAQSVLQQLLPQTGRALRIGITGVPGAGKSTLIEAFGTMLCDAGHKVAVLSVDPSSAVTGGSILGDKTRMPTLANRQNAFIRPSPAGKSLGGVARKSRETMLLCEAAGYDVILIETVGVGQSEVTVRSMVDFFLLVVLTGAGDELQGLKKGIMELADAIIVNKADGDNLVKARVAQGDYERMLEYIAPVSRGWKAHAYLCSALKKIGLEELWQVILKFAQTTKACGSFQERREKQLLAWVDGMINEHLHDLFYKNPVIIAQMPKILQQVLQETLSPAQAVQKLLLLFEQDK